MPYRSLADVAAETQSELLAGLVPYFTSNNELLTWLDSEVIDRPSVTINRVEDIGSAGPLACNTSIESEAISAGPAEFNLKQFYRAFDVCGQTESAMGNKAFVDEVGENLAGAAQALGDLIASQIVLGNGAGTNILGFDSIVTNSFAIDGANTTLSDLDALIDAVDFKSGKMAFVANKATRRNIKRLLNEEGDKTRVELADNMFVPGYEGIPMLAHTAVPNGQIYLINGDKNLRGSYMIYGDRPGDVLAPFRLVDVGWRETSDRRQWRLIVQAAVVTKSTQSLARLTGVN